MCACGVSSPERGLLSGPGGALALIVTAGEGVRDLEADASTSVQGRYPQEDFAALIVALHKISQLTLPFILFGAGLPMVAGLAGEAKSYAERLFD